MKISLDLDGVFIQHREFFLPLIQFWRAQGHKVGILSCHAEQPHDLDFWISTGFENEAQKKAEAIVQNSIDVSFDDRGVEIIQKLKAMGKANEHLVFANYSVYNGM